MFASRIGLSDDRTNRNDEADNDTDGVPDLISSESDDDNGDLDIVLPAILSTNLNDEADNDIDGVPDLISSESDDDYDGLPDLISSESDDDTGDSGCYLDMNSNVGHTHASVLRHYGLQLPFPCSDAGCDLDMLLPAILSTNLNDEADNDIDGVPDSVLPAILSTNKKDEADNDTGSVLNRFVEGHTHESIDQQFKKLQSLSSMQEMD